MNNQPIKLNCTFEGDKLPQYEKPKDSGMDLRAWKFKEVSNGELLPSQDFLEEGYVLMPHDRILVMTGLKIEYTEGIDARIQPRSGLSLKHGIMAILGQIEEEYRSDHGVIILNTSNDPYTIHRGDRLGQIVFSKRLDVELNLVEELNKTNRGSQGFGSSGVK